MKRTHKKTTTIFTSIKTKIILLVLFSVLTSTILFISTFLPRMQSTLNSNAENNILDISAAYSALVDSAYYIASPLSDTDSLDSMLKNANLKGINSSYAYLTDFDGTMLYHPTAEKIGKPVENNIIKDVISDLKNNKIHTSKVVKYDFNNTKKYAGYTVSQTSQTILVISADENEIMAPITSLYKSTIEIAIIILIILFIISFLVATTITNPIRTLTRSLSKMADLDFQQDKTTIKLLKHHDETGEIARAVEKMKQSLIDIVEHIRLSSKQLNVNTESINKIMTLVNEHSSDNSATSEELASGTEETASAIETIDANINHIKTSSNDITQKTVSGDEMALAIMKRASELKTNTQLAIKNTNEMYINVKNQSSLAIQQSKSVEKINSLTNAIMEIADQTSLLALNASIEAARAGEHGRGFTVVANEISHLAEQSTNTISHITVIVNEVQGAVLNMADCLETSLEFLEKKVLVDYNTFSNVSLQYHTDAKNFQDSMGIIYQQMNELNTITQQISQAISDITITILESSTGVTEIAEKTGDVVSLITQTYDMVKESLEHSKELENMTKRFKL